MGKAATAKKIETEEKADISATQVSENKTVPESQTGSTDIAAQTEALAGSWPEIQPHAVEAMRAENSVHEETPELSETPAPKKRGRPPGSKSSVSTLAKKVPGSNKEISTAPAVPATDYKMMGAQCAQMTFLLGTVIGGADFAPMQKNPITQISDQEMLTDAYAKYAEAKQMNDLPPGMALGATLMVYIASRLQFPNTQSRLQKIGGFFKHIWSKIKGRKNGARSNGGDNAVRENDTKQETSAVS